MRPCSYPYVSKGFTLLEILIVLSISTALLVFVTPDFYNAISGAALPKSTSQLATALQYGQSQAISLSKPVSLTLNVNKHHYRLSTRADVYVLPEDIDLTLLTGTTLLQGDGEGMIIFYPDGSSTGGRITLSYKENNRQIDINWLTGEVTVNNEV